MTTEEICGILDPIWILQGILMLNGRAQELLAEEIRKTGKPAGQLTLDELHQLDGIVRDRYQKEYVENRI